MLHYSDLLIRAGFVVLKIFTISTNIRIVFSEWMGLEKNQLKTCWAV